jgi:hypothetical protein
MTEPITIRGALMRFLVLATNPKRFRWLAAWALMTAAEWLSRLARRVVPRADAAAVTITGTHTLNGPLLTGRPVCFIHDGEHRHRRRGGALQSPPTRLSS